MHATPSIAPVLDGAVWADAERAASAWRGSLVQRFAQAEAAVSETLLVLAADPGGANVQLRHLVGQRFEDLGAAIAESGPFASEGAACREPLARFRTHDALRALVCHDTAKVALDKRGGWLVVLKTLSLRSGMTERTTKAFDQQDAEAMLLDLERAWHQLSCRLGVLRAAVLRRA